MFICAGLTDTGLKRNHNEDALLIDELNGLFVVSDGMGGHERGGVASRIVVESFKDMFCEDEDSTLSGLEDKDEEKLNRAIDYSAHIIKNYALNNSIDGYMGATVVGIYKIEEQKVAVFHLGDSRAYRIRDFKIEKLTRDHSLYEEMKSSGIYTEQELSNIGRNKITRAVGNFTVFPLEINYFSLKNNDFFILCSDGVSDLCRDEELLDIVMQEQNNLDRAIDNIKNLIYRRGAKDNLSLIIIRYLQ